MRIEAHVLFVDDHPDICEMVQVVMHAAGFRVSVADNVPDALKLAGTESFDAMVLDYCLPEATGVELCRQIRSFDPITPILICSGLLSAPIKEAAVLAGAQGYVEKPFNSNDLVQSVRAAINPDRREAW
jgi:DNA-binding response OmpR family regulator